MVPIKASELELFKGRKIRVVYVVDKNEMEGSKAVWDDLITPPVLLKGHNPNTGEVEIQRTGKAPEKIKFKELYPAD